MRADGDRAEPGVGQLGDVPPGLGELCEDGARVLRLRSTATFASYLALKERIVARAKEHARVVVDLAAAPLVDHTTQERLHDLSLELADSGMKLETRGLDRHRVLGDLPTALRKRVAD